MLQAQDSMEALIIMTFEEFQHLARLYVVGALDPDEMERFEAGREHFGPRGEAFIDSCRKLGTALALSLDPIEPFSDTKERLMEQIRKQQLASGRPQPSKPSEVNATDAFFTERVKVGRRRC